MQLSVVAQGKTVVQAQFDSLSLIIIIAVACVLGTSIIWLVIIYHTKKSIGGGGGGGPRGGSTTAINNSAAMATMLTVGDGSRVCANGGGEYARTSLLGNHSPLGSPVIVASGLMGPRMLNMAEGESLYLQQQPHGLIRNVSPVRVSRVDEQQLMRMRHQPEEDSRSCKDSGNGDSAKERNPTSSDEDEEVDAMLELQERQRRGGGPISIQRNRLNEYLGDVGGVVYVEKGSVLPAVEVRGGSSSFKGSSSGSSGNNSSLSCNNSNVAYVGATTA